MVTNRRRIVVLVAALFALLAAGASTAVAQEELYVTERPPQVLADGVERGSAGAPGSADVPTRVMPAEISRSQPAAAPAARGLAVTGADIVQLTAFALAAIGIGYALRRRSRAVLA